MCVNESCRMCHNHIYLTVRALDYVDIYYIVLDIPIFWRVADTRVIFTVEYLRTMANHKTLRIKLMFAHQRLNARK